LISSNKEITVVNLGLSDYKPTWDLQRAVFDLRQSGETDDVLLLTEHSHVYTLGKNSDANHLLASDEELKESGADVYHVDRGGDITYHGPGQLVGYPILHLADYYCDVHRYLRDIEEVIIRTLNDFGISARRDEEFTGVWVGSEKIAAIGVKVSHWVTMHGFALNVNTDLSYFERIIPCGIFHRGVTSLQRVLGTSIPIESVTSRIVHHFGCVFNRSVIRQAPEKFIESIQQQVSESTECQV
jgi:lipoate-protein ligase B